ncbi:acylphosphatase [Streptohalobacillus salinus]|uniref:Acylphosphatase n=1 Tax=Streptohalobacillus salinus TaxID=621096 RepID=A0A2V3WST6_9BACI|nr:acylphosphatase [Streptohalobacillus salinus]PXW91779.1 acylphosphatase [Streptohalobacillus salinus]
MDQLHAHLNIQGRVQGVGFRFMTQKKAKEIGVFGYVKNLMDGSVEVEIEGDVDKVYQLIDHLKEGPSPSADVTNVDIDVTEELSGFNEFKVIH